MKCNMCGDDFPHTRALCVHRHETHGKPLPRPRTGGGGRAKKRVAAVEVTSELEVLSECARWFDQGVTTGGLDAAGVQRVLEYLRGRFEA